MPSNASNGNQARTSDKPWRLATILFLFVWGAVAINLFLLAMLLGWLDSWPWGAEWMTPWRAMHLAIPLSFPATWLTTRWVQNMLREAGD